MEGGMAVMMRFVPMGEDEWYPIPPKKKEIKKNSARKSLENDSSSIDDANGTIPAETEENNRIILEKEAIYLSKRKYVKSLMMFSMFNVGVSDVRILDSDEEISRNSNTMEDIEIIGEYQKEYESMEMIGRKQSSKKSENQKPSNSIQNDKENTKKIVINSSRKSVELQGRKLTTIPISSYFAIRSNKPQTVRDIFPSTKEKKDKANPIFPTMKKANLGASDEGWDSLSENTESSDNEAPKITGKKRNHEYHIKDGYYIFGGDNNNDRTGEGDDFTLDDDYDDEIVIERDENKVTPIIDKAKTITSSAKEKSSSADIVSLETKTLNDIQENEKTEVSSQLAVPKPKRAKQRQTLDLYLVKCLRSIPKHNHESEVLPKKIKITDCQTPFDAPHNTTSSNSTHINNNRGSDMKGVYTKDELLKDLDKEYDIHHAPKISPKYQCDNIPETTLDQSDMDHQNRIYKCNHPGHVVWDINQIRPERC